MVRQAAAKTNDLAGDGTTTSVVLAQGMITEGVKVHQRKNFMTRCFCHSAVLNTYESYSEKFRYFPQIVAAGANPVQITRGIEKTAKALVNELQKMSKEVSSDYHIILLLTLVFFFLLALNNHVNTTQPHLASGYQMTLHTVPITSYILDGTINEISIVIRLFQCGFHVKHGLPMCYMYWSNMCINHINGLCYEATMIHSEILYTSTSNLPSFHLYVVCIVSPLQIFSQRSYARWYVELRTIATNLLFFFVTGYSQLLLGA